jgi:hypothetical protein
VKSGLAWPDLTAGAADFQTAPPASETCVKHVVFKRVTEVTSMVGRNTVSAAAQNLLSTVEEVT